MKSKYSLYIGIDTGTHTGVSIWDGRKFIDIRTVKIHNAFDMVIFYHGEYFNIGEKIFVRFEYAQGVGSVKRDASIWEDFLTDKRIDFEAVHPIKGATKWKPDYFKQVTGWKGKTSEHGRDSAMLVFNFSKYIPLEKFLQNESERYF